jgi:hypothetical protein
VNADFGLRYLSDTWNKHDLIHEVKCGREMRANIGSKKPRDTDSSSQSRGNINVRGHITVREQVFHVHEPVLDGKKWGTHGDAENPRVPFAILGAEHSRQNTMKLNFLKPEPRLSSAGPGAVCPKLGRDTLHTRDVQSKQASGKSALPAQATLRKWRRFIMRLQHGF